MCAKTRYKVSSNDLKGKSCYGKEEILNMKKIWNE